MSFKTLAQTAFDALGAGFLKRGIGQVDGGIRVAPVLHVESLDDDRHFNQVVDYAEHFKEVTGAKVLATVMTPLSPLVQRRLEANRFSPAEYLRRIQRLAQASEIGLHGHFVRRFDGSSVWPMHAAFFDRDAIEEQLRLETRWLEQHGLFSSDVRIYSGGWWFSNHQIRSQLKELGYAIDFTLSSNPFNVTPFASRFKRELRHGLALRTEDGLVSFNALCSVAQKRRPKATVNRLALASRGKTSPVFTLYSHDYDLNLTEAKACTQLLADAGVKFVGSQALAVMATRAAECSPAP
ncbi:hypothetical protein [Hydrogenophaga sp. RWCD_12]|uniref:hypothetical protein n=1 Tax=Hydrogenophaga sp. RWCD_12 TaxID=3391190 RepID=UPI0039848C05